jgi:hypothetical protein
MALRTTEGFLFAAGRQRFTRMRGHYRKDLYERAAYFRTSPATYHAAVAGSFRVAAPCRPPENYRGKFIICVTFAPTNSSP